MEKLAPIAVFAYNRPEHLNKTLGALSQNYGATESKLNIFIDGPKDIKDKSLVKQNLKYIKNWNHAFKSVDVFQKRSNMGLARSIIEGVTFILDNHHTIIVLEDDLVTAQNFLKFINSGLFKYRTNKKVASIHGYVQPFKQKLDSPFFLRGGDCWGWGTWSDRWRLFNSNGNALMRSLLRSGEVDEFDLGGAYPFSSMLQDQIDGKNDSWAIRWHASMFINQKLTLYPCQTYVKNIGFDGSGTHTGRTNIFDSKLCNHLQKLPDRVEPSKQGFKLMADWYSEVYFGKKTKLRNKLNQLLYFEKNFQYLIDKIKLFKKSKM